MPTVTIQPDLLAHLNAFHEVDRAARLEELTDTINHLGSLGRNVAAIQAVLAECCTAYLRERVVTRQQESARDATETLHRARRHVLEAVEELGAYWDEHPDIPALREIAERLTVSPFVDDQQEPVDMPLRRTRAGRPWIHKPYDLKLKDLRVPSEERAAMFEALGITASRAQ
jgi:hypothetical protein